MAAAASLSANSEAFISFLALPFPRSSGDFIRGSLLMPKRLLGHKGDETNREREHETSAAIQAAPAP